MLYLHITVLWLSELSWLSLLCIMSWKAVRDPPANTYPSVELRSHCMTSRPWLVVTVVCCTCGYVPLLRGGGSPSSRCSLPSKNCGTFQNFPPWHERYMLAMGKGQPTCTVWTHKQSNLHLNDLSWFVLKIFWRNMFVLINQRPYSAGVSLKWASVGSCPPERESHLLCIFIFIV